MSNKLVPFTTLLIALLISQANADDATIYHSQNNKSTEQAIGYSKTNVSLARYLSYRDIPGIIARYAQGKNALDLGAGTGLSTQFLIKQGLDVTGADISDEMLRQAAKICPDTPLHLIENGTTPFVENTFDIVFSSLVLFELGTMEEIVAYLKEAKRIMKDDAVLIALTGSEHMYTKDWLMFNTDYPENKELKSGDLAKIYLHDANIEFTDYYWTEADYQDAFEQAGLQLLDVHYPVGCVCEPYQWKDEIEHSPFVIFSAKKSN